MRFEYDDGGRKAAGYKGHAGDCVCRAIAIVSGRPYREVYDALAAGMGSQRRTKRSGKRARSARNGVCTTRKWFKDQMAAWGFTWHPTMGIGTGCTVHLHDGELPAGKLVVAVSGHYTAVVDGTIRDTHDPQRETLNYQGNEIASVSRRCVYGYWTLAGRTPAARASRHPTRLSPVEAASIFGPGMLVAGVDCDVDYDPRLTAMTEAQASLMSMDVSC